MRIPVPYGMGVEVEIRRTEDAAYVDVYAPFYARKVWTMPHSYAASFTDEQILADSDFKAGLTIRYGRASSC